MKLTVSYNFLPKQHSTNAAIVMDHFGLDFEQGQHVIADDLDVPIQPGNVACWTGASGSGKSSLMRAAANQLNGVVNIDELDLGSRLLIDSLPCGVQESLQILASCGLSEAQLMLRTPTELSDGQRYRFRLAFAIAQRPKWILADEFTATLDRTLAKVIAFNVRRVSQRTGIGFLLATTHDDVLDDLSPDVHVKCDVDGEIKVNVGCHENTLSGNRVASVAPLPGSTELTGGNATRLSNDKPPTAVAAPIGKQSGSPQSCAVTLQTSPSPKTRASFSTLPQEGESNDTRKKKESASRTNSGSAKRPEPTGRTSLGGITAVITSVSQSSL